MSTITVGIWGLILFVLFLFMGIPIATGMTIVGLLGYAFLTNLPAALHLLSIDFFTSFSSYNMSAIAMFTLMGYLAFYSGIGSRLYSFANKMVGHLPGGLAMATQVACACFGAVCGSSAATAATIGAISLPEMKKYRYDPSLSTASVAAGGALGILIPPSMIFIVYGVATEQSIGRLFIAGIAAGILLMLLFMLTIYILTLRNPDIAPRGERYSWKERFLSMGAGLSEIAIIFFLSIIGLSLGWYTPTEAGGFGAALILLVCLIRKQLTWKGFVQSLTDTAKTTGMVLYLVAGATLFGRFIAISKIPFEIAKWATSLSLPASMVLLLIVGIYLIAGCFIDALPLVLLTVPIFYPVVIQLGFDPIWFGVIIVLVVAMGVITPPVGMNVYVIKGVAKDVPLEVIFKGIWPFLGAILVCILILLLFPQIVLFLPNLLM